MKVIVAGRQEGKTTRMLQWLRAAPEDEHRVIVSHTTQRATELYRANREEFESWQFVGPDDVTRQSWSGVLFGRGGRIVLGIEDLDLQLSRLFHWEVGAMSITSEADASRRDTRVSKARLLC